MTPKVIQSKFIKLDEEQMVLYYPGVTVRIVCDENAKQDQSGNFETVRIESVPSAVLTVAQKIYHALQSSRDLRGINSYQGLTLI